MVADVSVLNRHQAISNHHIDSTVAIMSHESSQIAKFMGPTWGPPGPCGTQMGPMLAPWILLSGITCKITYNAKGIKKVMVTKGREVHNWFVCYHGFIVSQWWCSMVKLTGSIQRDECHSMQGKTTETSSMLCPVKCVLTLSMKNNFLIKICFSTS